MERPDACVAAPAWGIPDRSRIVPRAEALPPLHGGLSLKDSINFAYAVGAKKATHKIMEFNPDSKVLHFHANESTRPHS